MRQNLGKVHHIGSNVDSVIASYGPADIYFRLNPRRPVRMILRSSTPGKSVGRVPVYPGQAQQLPLVLPGLVAVV